MLLLALSLLLGGPPLQDPDVIRQQQRARAAELLAQILKAQRCNGGWCDVTYEGLHLRTMKDPSPDHPHSGVVMVDALGPEQSVAAAGGKCLDVEIGPPLSGAYSFVFRYDGAVKSPFLDARPFEGCD